jgi:hypothetical protein
MSYLSRKAKNSTANFYLKDKAGTFVSKAADSPLLPPKVLLLKRYIFWYNTFNLPNKQQFEIQ